MPVLQGKLNFPVRKTRSSSKSKTPVDVSSTPDLVSVDILLKSPSSSQSGTCQSKPTTSPTAQRSRAALITARLATASLVYDIDVDVNGQQIDERAPIRKVNTPQKRKSKGRECCIIYIYIYVCDCK